MSHLSAAAASVCMWSSSRSWSIRAGLRRDAAHIVATCGRTASPSRWYHGWKNSVEIIFVFAFFYFKWRRWSRGEQLRCSVLRTFFSLFCQGKQPIQRNTPFLVVFLSTVLWGIMTTGQDESSVRVALRWVVKMYFILFLVRSCVLIARCHLSVSPAGLANTCRSTGNICWPTHSLFL